MKRVSVSMEGSNQPHPTKPRDVRVDYCIVTGRFARLPLRHPWKTPFDHGNALKGLSEIHKSFTCFVVVARVCSSYQYIASFSCSCVALLFPKACIWALPSAS